MTNEMWLEWQKLCIREEYKDAKLVDPVRTTAHRLFDETVRESLAKVRLNVQD